MNTALTEQTNADGNNVYGAVSFRQADSSSGIYDYTVHVRGAYLVGATAAAAAAAAAAGFCLLLVFAT